MIKRALIPAAGRGLRLDRPGTPKPLVDVGGLPLIVRLIGQLARAGIERITVVVGYDGPRVSRVLAGHPGLGVELEILENRAWQDGLASSLLVARDRCTEPFLLAMADHVFDEALVGALASAEPDAETVIALVDTRLDDVFALEPAVKVRLDGDLVVDIARDLAPYDAVDTGLFAATPALFTALETVVAERDEAELTDGLRLLAGQRRLYAHRAADGRWDDVDTPADLIHAEMRLRAAKRQAAVRMDAARDRLPPGDEHQFVVTQPKPARIVVGRGFVRSPERLPLIPAEAASSPIFVFTDETVNGLYGERFIGALQDTGSDVNGIVLPDGEESKSLANYVYLIERVLGRGVDERSVFISLGGGVVCNVCGFIASTIYRGLDLVHLPTTVMAQTDAAISHKQGINSHRGKNMVGSYFLPRLVAADVEVLETLDERLKYDGVAEVIKHAIGQDRAYVELLLEHGDRPLDLDFFEQVVRRNVELKCALAATDPKEHREAMILQYGHTVGHAVEHLTGYRLYHGESVAVGMMVAARVSRLLGGCGDELVELHEQLCRLYRLPTAIPREISTDDVLASLKYNKKYLTEGTRMALLADVGELWSIDDDYAIPVSDQVLAEAVELTKERA